MNPKGLEAFAREAAKHLKTEKDPSDFTHMLTKVRV
jgi:putative transposase